ncbi:MAG: hypothetical protein H0T86_07895 [Gemmatimonadales bacterium]|nr:hypothetical protein [Gemmatimonadales bacterium]
MFPRALLLAGGVLTAGCASPAARPSSHPAPVASASCLIATDSTGPDRPITAAFQDPADAARSRRAESVTTPIRLDCQGRTLPALAVAWSRDSTARFWTLELREPEPSDGVERWTAAALAATWRADPEANAALEWGGVESLVPIDARRVVVGFSAPALELPTLFADRALGVTYGAGRPGIVPAPPGGDLRDAVDRATDLIQTGDPDLLDYARQQPGLTIAPLPWSRSYLLVLPSWSPGAGTMVPADTAAFRAGLARDVARTDARVPEAPFWWKQRDACLRSGTSVPRRERLHAVVYSAADGVARDLAERIVALAERSELTARGLPADSFVTALHAGGAVAFVLAVPTHAPLLCRETAAWPPQVAVVPLVETRMHAIVRRGVPPIVVEWDGTVRAAGAGEKSRAR